MKNFKLASIALIIVLSLSTVSPVLAAENSVGETDGNISFVINDDPTKPVDPTDPSKPDPGGNDGDNEETKNQGPLSLDVIPKQFKFGTQKVSATAATYKNTPESTNKLNYLQVTDNRSELNGWSVNVGMTEFTSTTSDVLAGATLVLPSGVARNSTTGETPVSNISTKGGTISADELNTLTVFGVDNSGVGKATSVNTWNAAEVALNVPGGQSKEDKTYESTITWTLTANVYS
ncbi:WxL domain-containing protein [Enterococcus sp. AZ103]|uniref:WxL domain-containing protein n=1 Tax=Enterococcus sp. AZ103 TaxID=2774628 RepID=UPI003F272436